MQSDNSHKKETDEARASTTKHTPSWVFFGTSDFSVIILEQMKARGYTPNLIVTTEDKPKGRKLILTSSPVAAWAEAEGILHIKPRTLKGPEIISEIASHARNPKLPYDIFVVASYGKLIPQPILDMPLRGVLNVHPSLLPRLRGASPIQSAILTESETGVTIMRLDALMDHGPLVAQEKIVSWTDPDMNDIPYANDLEKLLGGKGGELLASVFEPWIRKEIEEKEQDHTKATACGKMEKAHGELDLSQPAEVNLRKIRAYQGWPTAYFFDIHDGKKTRIIVTKAHIENDTLVIDRVIPEGKKEIAYSPTIPHTE